MVGIFFVLSLLSENLYMKVVKATVRVLVTHQWQHKSYLWMM